MKFVMLGKSAINLAQVLEITFHGCYIRFYFTKTDYTDWDGSAEVIAAKTLEIKKILKINKL